MGFGVGDLFGIFAGGAWLAKENIASIGEQSVDKTRSELIQAYILENTDSALEEKLRKDIEDPDKYDEIWQRIERFKRDNPTMLWKKLHQKTGTICYAGFSLLNVRTYGVEDIGKKRLPFRDSTGSMYGKSYAEEARLRDNREIALSLLIWTYGKETKTSAVQNAERIYPLPRGKIRNW